MKNLFKKNITVGGLCKFYAIAWLIGSLTTLGMYLYMVRPFSGFFKKKKKVDKK